MGDRPPDGILAAISFCNVPTLFDRSTAVM